MTDSSVYPGDRKKVHTLGRCCELRLEVMRAWARRWNRDEESPASGK